MAAFLGQLLASVVSSKLAAKGNKAGAAIVGAAGNAAQKPSTSEAIAAKNVTPLSSSSRVGLQQMASSSPLPRANGPEAYLATYPSRNSFVQPPPAPATRPLAPPPSAANPNRPFTTPGPTTAPPQHTAFNAIGPGLPPGVASPTPMMGQGLAGSPDEMRRRALIAQQMGSGWGR